MLLSTTVIDTTAMTITGPFPAGTVYGSPYQATVTGGQVNYAVSGPVSMPAGDSLVVQGTQAALINTTAFQTYSGPVTLSVPAITFQPQSGGLTFTSQIAGQNTDLTATAGSPTTLGGTVSVRSFTSSGFGNVVINGGGVTTAGNQIYGSGVNVGANATLTASANGQITIFGATSGSAAGLTVAGASGATFGGAVTLGALTTGVGLANLANGGTVGTLSVNAGTFEIGGLQPTVAGAASAGAASAGAAAKPAVSGPSLNVTVQSIFAGGTTTIVPAGWTLSSAGPALITGSGATIQLASAAASPAVLALGGDLSFTAASGSASIVTTGGLALPGLVDLGATARSMTVNAGALSVGAQLADGALRAAGLGVLQLSGSNAYTGGTTIVGTLEADSPGALGSGPLAFAGGTLVLRSGAGATYANPLTAAAPANSISLDVGAGTYQFPSAALGAALNVAGSGSLTIGGAVTLPGVAQFPGPVTVNITAALTFAGVVSGGAAGLSKTLAGTLTLSGAAANAYTGTTTITGGSLVLDKAAATTAVPGDLLIDGASAGASVLLQQNNQIAANHAVTFDGTAGPATLNLNGHGQTLATIGAVPLTPHPENDIVALGAGAAGALTVGGAASFDFPGTITGAGTLIKTGAGTLTLDAAQAFATAAALTVSAGTIRMTAAGSANTLSALSINTGAGARLDLGTGSLRINYGLPAADPVSTIRGFLSSGFAGGAWNGAGLMTSAAGLALGYADSAEPGTPVAGLAANQILVRYARPGDANLDGAVNFIDLMILARHFGASPASWDQGDFDYNATAGLADLLALAHNYGRTTAGSPAAAAAVHPAALPSRQMVSALIRRGRRGTRRAFTLARDRPPPAFPGGMRGSG